MAPTSDRQLRVPGGCDDCDAYQTVTVDRGVACITVHHDETCPWLAALERDG